MEDGWRISSTKRHHQEVKRTIPGPDACLWDVFVPDPDLVVARPKFEGGEVGSALKAVEDFIDL
jgi:hypothetical protein